MSFTKEKDFQNALTELLTTKKGWLDVVLKYPSQNDLIANWKAVLEHINQNKLNGRKISDNEMDKILNQLRDLKTPNDINKFINGKEISIMGDDGLPLVLFNYDRNSIGQGKSVYQIAIEPKFDKTSNLGLAGRGDMCLLINGMPLIHIELKRSGVPVREACNQIEKYSKRGYFTGIFSLIQIFVAMNPDEALYFANPGKDGKFNDKFFFNWADVDNIPINRWDKFAGEFLNIPKAHELVGFYTIADRSDGVLKVMRSYQYYASSAIRNIVSKAQWGNIRGGYVWHTTGSGKTMTSFKSAQLISEHKLADKVVFLVDRIELGIQSSLNYKSFCLDDDDVIDTKSCDDLIKKLADDENTLIITSIQKMGKIDDEIIARKNREFDKIAKKRMVIIIDEAHRSTFGENIKRIRDNFKKAILFGFTGTPIHNENAKDNITTSDIFGDEIHRYNISDGIRDGNVLGFDITAIKTYKDSDIKEKVALKKANAKSIDEAMSEPKKQKIYDEYMTKPMSELEKIADSIFDDEKHKRLVVRDIKDRFTSVSRAGRYHAIFTTRSIEDAIIYYKLFKEITPELKVAGLFDPSIDNSSLKAFDKEAGILEMLQDYNDTFNKSFTMQNYKSYKADISARLAHKDAYKNIAENQKLNILIVVDMMLTGYDSKWVNTIFIDRLMEYEKIIQSFSRTNRVFDAYKLFGNVFYYYKTNTMKENIDKAFKLYGDSNIKGLFVDKIKDNLQNLNKAFDEICSVFSNAGISDFSSLPSDDESIAKFAKAMKMLEKYKNSAELQGFRLDDVKNGVYECQNVEVRLNNEIYAKLIARYNDIVKMQSSRSGDKEIFEIDPHLSECAIIKIDIDYINTHFKKLLKALSDGDIVDIENIKNDIHRSFGILSEEDQEFARTILADIENDKLKASELSFGDLLISYKNKNKDEHIKSVCENLGIDENSVKKLINERRDENNLNQNNDFENIIDKMDLDKAGAFLKECGKYIVSLRDVKSKAKNMVKNLILSYSTK
ncbi:type I restriction endonuclease subunit R [Campylobacter hyointestinalis]|uniref:type I restriction endonuclease subunit R n=1 Tax=Campylobacter hyointestinalis TaxID=198 RepID=UPI000726AEA1|nr:HsdR family type I site-specific deoxyribonuclease [Campylobacter hyointestinalis]CUU85275.1 type I restriction enzyme EcoR124II R protein (R.EcoR124II) [Campylobacter hyointestinalis subsp. hyointestinalis]